MPDPSSDQPGRATVMLGPVATPPDSGSSKSPGDEAAPGTPQTGENVCPRCGGSGKLDGSDCPDCEGSGTVVVNVGDA